MGFSLMIVRKMDRSNENRVKVGSGLIILSRGGQWGSWDRGVLQIWITLESIFGREG